MSSSGGSTLQGETIMGITNSDATSQTSTLKKSFCTETLFTATLLSLSDKCKLHSLNVISSPSSFFQQGDADV